MMRRMNRHVSARLEFDALQDAHLALQVAVVELPFLQAAFGTVPLDPEHWAWSVGLALLVAVPVELEKAWRRLRSRAAGRRR